MTRKQRIYDVLYTKLDTDILIIDDESQGHHVPIGAETHFKVTVVSNHFDKLSRVARHRQINNLLVGEFATGLHALSLHLYTPGEWEKLLTGVPPSPACQRKKHHG